MKRIDVINKINELINCENGVIEYLKKETERLLSCGAVDSEDYADNFLLPKIILVVALKNCSKAYGPAPSDRRATREIKNLEHF